jgi:flavin reductase (DIM6/NTAB) family NADH-FMN oxidoreductase RutF
MEVDPAHYAGSVYHLMTSTVIPRPIGWASSLDRNGVRNLAPFSFFNVVSGDPPIVMISVGQRKGQAKDTLANIIETREFVMNIVGEHVAQQMNATSGNFASHVDEFEVSGLTAVPSVKVRAPRVGEAAVTMECVLWQSVPLPRSEYTVIFGEVVWLHIDDALLDERGRVDPQKLAPVARLGGSSWYTTLGQLFEMQRPP